MKFSDHKPGEGDMVHCVCWGRDGDHDHMDITDETLLTWRRSLAARLGDTRTVTDWPQVVDRAARWADTSPTILTTEQLEGYLGQGRSAATARTYGRGLRAWHRWLVASGRRGDDPMARVGLRRVPPAEPRPITTAQLQAVLAHPGLRQATRAKILLGAFCGLRVAEIARVRGEDFDWAGPTPRLHIVGKGQKPAWLPINNEVAALAQVMPPRGWWFPGQGDGPVTPGSVSATIRRAMQAAGVDATAHQLRHWHATTLVDAGAPLTEVRVLMRHSSILTTQRYVRVDQGRLGRDVQLLGDLVQRRDAA